MINVEVIADSIHNNNRLTTLQVSYPRYIHSEFMTHRVFSRNAQSSRAIPVSKLIEEIEKSNWYPIWMTNKSGMSAEEGLNSVDIEDAKYLWDAARRNAIDVAYGLSNLKVHKQIVNRVLEPFSTIKVIVSATDWDNFFNLRIHPAAQQEIQILATTIRDLMNTSTPTRLDIGQWHLPYLREDEAIFNLDLKKAISTARCARVSYLNHTKQNDLSKDIQLHDQLLAEKHMSPFEHQATPWANTRSANFQGWRQYRYEVEGRLIGRL